MVNSKNCSLLNNRRESGFFMPRSGGANKVHNMIPEDMKQPLPYTQFAEISSLSVANEISLAISSTAELVKDSSSVEWLILLKHLRALCDLQLNKLSGLE